MALRKRMREARERSARNQQPQKPHRLSTLARVAVERPATVLFDVRARTSSSKTWLSSPGPVPESRVCTKQPAKLVFRRVLRKSGRRARCRCTYISPTDQMCRVSASVLCHGQQSRRGTMTASVETVRRKQACCP